MKRIIILIASLFLITCNDNVVSDNSQDNENTSWVFVANEGNYGSTNGTISMIDDNGNVYETDIIGDVVQALEVYENKLIVLVNKSNLIKIYDITENGLSMPGIEVSIGSSEPRDLVVVNDKVYFTNWVTEDVQVFNLFTYAIEASIPIDGLPEDIEFDGQYLWVTIPHSDSYFTAGNTVCKIDINSNTIIETIDVGSGPQQLTFDDAHVYVSRTFYSDDWLTTYHGATKIGEEIITNNYGAGTACGGSILKYENNIYRSFDGGVSPMNEDLSLNSNNKIGNYNQEQIYHVEEINGNIWFAITDYSNLNEVRVINLNGDEIAKYDVGLMPGDFAIWKNNN
tara:strand:- start:1364 stop:2383 length:1020 start_codon:yes stop_codon:yes gene_type:complete